MNILLIDDDDGIRSTVRDLLEMSGHAVTAAATGEEGLGLAVAACPDLIICDVDMPGMNGFEVIAAIQRQPQCRDVPFIFLTGRVERADQRRGMTLGADDYITKPFTAQDLLDAIAARVGRQQPLKARIQQLVDEKRQEAAADWSHELMTPLNAVFGGLDLIEMEIETIKPPDLKQLLDMIRQGAERQEHLARKLIRYYGLERLQAAPVARMTPADVEPGVTAGAAHAAQGEGRTADLQVDCEPGRVALDESLLADAVAELVENACRFSPKGQLIRVIGRRHDNVYRVEVIDRGAGMAPAQRSVTGAFVQINRQRQAQQGLGLGLAIARATASLAGGQLQLEDAPDGPGLKAVLELPVAS